MGADGKLYDQSVDSFVFFNCWLWLGRVHPGLAGAAMLETRVGLRPLSADGLPVVGPVPGVVGAYVATGHGPSGLTLGPYSAALVTELVLGRAPALDLTPFRADRFAAAR